MTPSNGLFRNRTISLIILLSTLYVAYSVDYCITKKPYDVVPILGNETVALTLGDYVRGYNLSFTSSESGSARPFNPLNMVAERPLGFKEGI